MLVLTTTQKANYRAEFLDRKDHVTVVQGAPVWTVSNPAAVELVPSNDGLSCDVIAVAPASEFQISVTGDADFGDGVEPVVLSDSIRVDPGRAVGGRLVAGAPVEQ
jgi:hypothetical protein